ncbi:MAG: hypothetical protein MJ113_02900 [Lachnospiraceae bacterium]|nr:hypothetical protein [Lachnospiraceae bacterium]
MSKIRRDYENSLWRKLVRFVYGENDSFHEKAGYDIEHPETEKRKEETFFEEVDYTKKKKESDKFFAKYSAIAEKRGEKVYNHFYKFLAAITCFSIIMILLVTVAKLPSFGNPDNPVNNEVSERYIEQGLEETGAVNIVAGMILDYRAFDTLGESHVLFIACVCVMILLRLDKETNDPEKLKALENDRDFEPKNEAILQHAAKILVPVIILFGIYIVLNGHISPGGGFAGGAIIGSGLILYLNAFGFKKTEMFFTTKTFSVVSVSSLLFYSLSKTYSFFTGANDLHSIIGPGTPGAILSAGLILPLNIAVGAVVACTMYGFYALFRKGGI